MERYLMTHSLLSSWLYAMKDSSYEDATTERDSYDEFMKTLRREPTETTKAMQNGIDFENLVTKIVNGESSQIRSTETQDGQQRLLDAKPLTENQWYDAANQIANIIKGAQLQYRARRIIQVGDMSSRDATGNSAILVASNLAHKRSCGLSRRSSVVFAFLDFDTKSPRNSMSRGKHNIRARLSLRIQTGNQLLHFTL